jgi:hypothetical protein
MTAADVTFNRYDPWYVKVVCHFSRRVPGDTAQCPKLYRAIGPQMRLVAIVASGPC